jgi:hypothetical protein
MANEMGPILNEVGNILARDTAYPLDGTFLYVEAEWQMVGMSIFKDVGDRLVYRDPMDGLAEILLELWEAAPADKQWSSMQYRINDGRFEASFTYEPLDPEVSSIDRREVILCQRYGNKRIDYPPL